MLDNIKNWWNREQIREDHYQLIEKQNIDLRAEREVLQSSLNELTQLNSQLQEVLRLKRLEDVARENKHNNKTPWIEITSDGFDEVKGVKVSLDWNDAFIAYLEDLSIKGPTEEAAVQRWLALVNLHLIDQLEAEAIENDPRGTVKDVVDGY